MLTRQLPASQPMILSPKVTKRTRTRSQSQQPSFPKNPTGRLLAFGAPEDNGGEQLSSVQSGIAQLALQTDQFSNDNENLMTVDVISENATQESASEPVIVDQNIADNNLSINEELYSIDNRIKPVIPPPQPNNENG